MLTIDYIFFSLAEGVLFLVLPLTIFRYFILKRPLKLLSASVLIVFYHAIVSSIVTSFLNYIAKPELYSTSNYIGVLWWAILLPIFTKGKNESKQYKRYGRERNIAKKMLLLASTDDEEYYATKYSEIIERLSTISSFRKAEKALKEKELLEITSKEAFCALLSKIDKGLTVTKKYKPSAEFKKKVIYKSKKVSSAHINITNKQPRTASIKSVVLFIAIGLPLVAALAAAIAMFCSDSSRDALEKVSPTLIYIVSIVLNITSSILLYISNKPKTSKCKIILPIIALIFSVSCASFMLFKNELPIWSTHAYSKIRKETIWYVCMEIVESFNYVFCVVDLLASIVITGIILARLLPFLKTSINSIKSFILKPLENKRTSFDRNEKYYKKVAKVYEYYKLGIITEQEYEHHKKELLRHINNLTSTHAIPPSPKIKNAPPISTAPFSNNKKYIVAISVLSVLLAASLVFNVVCCVQLYTPTTPSTDEYEIYTNGYTIMNNRDYVRDRINTYNISIDIEKHNDINQTQDDISYTVLVNESAKNQFYFKERWYPGKRIEIKVIIIDSDDNSEGKNDKGSHTFIYYASDYNETHSNKATIALIEDEGVNKGCASFWSVNIEIVNVD